MNRKEREDDLEREIRSHLDLESEESGKYASVPIRKHNVGHGGCTNCVGLGEARAVLSGHPLRSSSGAAQPRLFDDCQVSQRTQEIGVRMALGASSGEILRSFGGRGLALTVTGLGFGLALAFATARFLTSLLYGFQPDYVPAVAAVSGILLAVAAVACLVPARRASHIDPVVALRHE